MTGFASDGDMPNVPRPTLGMWKAADANDVKLIMLLINDRMWKAPIRLSVAMSNVSSRCLGETYTAIQVDMDKLSCCLSRSLSGWQLAIDRE